GLIGARIAEFLEAAGFIELGVVRDDRETIGASVAGELHQLLDHFGTVTLLAVLWLDPDSLETASVIAEGQKGADAQDLITIGEMEPDRILGVTDGNTFLAGAGLNLRAILKLNFFEGFHRSSPILARSIPALHVSYIETQM